MENDVKLLIDRSATKDILEMFGADINEENIIIDKESGEPVPTKEGTPIFIEEFGGIQEGSKIFIRNDLSVIIKLVNEKVEK